MIRNKVFALFVLLGFALVLSSGALGGRFILRSAELLDQLVKAKDLVEKTEYGKFGDTVYIEVRTRFPVTVPKLCDAVPLLRQNKERAITVIMEFNGISDKNHKRRVILVPLKAIYPPKYGRVYVS